MRVSRIATRLRGHRAGFTLLELLVAVAGLVLLTVMLFGVLSQLSSGWQVARSGIETRQKGRDIMDFMARELQSAALPADLTSKTGLQFLVDPTQIDASYLRPHALFWQAPVATDRTYGTMAEVGYFVRWDTTTNPKTPHAILCRLFVNPENPSSLQNYLIDSQPAEWLSPGGNAKWLDTVAPGDAASNYKGWFVDNVIALWVRCLDASGNAITRQPKPGTSTLSTTNYAYDSRSGYQTAAGMIKNGYRDSSGNYRTVCTLPATVELALVVIDSNTAGRVKPSDLAALQNYNSADPRNFSQEIDAYLNQLPPSIRSGARVYTSTVNLQNAK